MEIVSSKSVSFPKLNFGMNAGVPVEAPKDKKILETVLAHPCVSEVKAAQVNSKDK